MNLSGKLWIMENNISSSLRYNLWKNSFIWLWSLSSMFILINSLQIILFILENRNVFINSIVQNGEKDNGTYLNDLIRKHSISCNGKFKMFQYKKQRKIVYEHTYGFRGGIMDGK